MVATVTVLRTIDIRLGDSSGKDFITAFVDISYGIYRFYNKHDGNNRQLKSLFTIAEECFVAVSVITRVHRGKFLILNEGIWAFLAFLNIVIFQLISHDT
jgi:hypothetical protein